MTDALHGRENSGKSFNCQEILCFVKALSKTCLKKHAKLKFSQKVLNFSTLNNLNTNLWKYQDPDVGGDRVQDARHVVRLEDGGHGIEEQEHTVGVNADHK